MTTVTKDSPEIVGATLNRRNPTTGERESVPAYPTDADRIAAAVAWNTDTLRVARSTLEDAFRAEAIVRMTAAEAAFDTPAEVELVRAMARVGMLTARANWTAAGRLVFDLDQYLKAQAIPRVYGRGGHPDLSDAQLDTILAQVGDALPFAGVDGADTGWPV